MAEYIDRDSTISFINFHHLDENKDDYDLLVDKLCKEVKAIPPAEVVEKSTIMDLIKRGWSAENIITEIMRD